MAAIIDHLGGCCNMASQMLMRTEKVVRGARYGDGEDTGLIRDELERRVGIHASGVGFVEG